MASDEEKEASVDFVKTLQDNRKVTLYGCAALR
jgi:hypothetical protein